MLLQPITVPFSKSTLKPSVYTLIYTIPKGTNFSSDQSPIAGHKTAKNVSNGPVKYCPQKLYIKYKLCLFNLGCSDILNECIIFILLLKYCSFLVV